jgi:hypothetical protein
MKRLRTAVPIALLFLLSFAAQATPITYGLELRVGYLGCDFCGYPPIDPRIQVGNVYFGSFTVDDSILSADGLNLAGVISAFRISIEEIVWDSAVASAQNVFHGFRGPNGLFSPSPGFDVASGEIVNLRGGVFGESDFPFIDFSTDVRVAGDPGACGLGSKYCGNLANAFWTRNPLGEFGGTMTVVRQIPEPASLALFGLGLLVVALRRK